ncbi:MAG TPA: hypothetical protein VH280_07310 [Verrucomicrobiae bacterium]|nr:hypothetical protein [Verrucomicrobiae bacterium]
MPIRARIHYLVCDAKGDCATIEFLGGTMRVHRGKDLPWHALANDSYLSEEAYLKAHPQHDDTKPLTNTDSLPRFCRAAMRAADFQPAEDPGHDIAYAFNTLNQVRQGQYTVWQIVYDVSDRKIYWRTRSNRKERCLDLKTVDFASDKPVRCADIQSNTSPSDTLKFQDWNEAAARKFATHLFNEESFKQEVGDVTWMIEPTLLLLRTYSVAQ